LWALFLALKGLVDYRLGAANRKTHHFLMIFDFETLFLRQKFEFRDNQRYHWIGKLLLARQSVLSNFCRGAELVKINSIEKQVAKSSKSDDFATSRKHTRVS